MTAHCPWGLESCAAAGNASAAVAAIANMLNRLIVTNIIKMLIMALYLQKIAIFREWCIGFVKKILYCNRNRSPAGKIL